MNTADHTVSAPPSGPPPLVLLKQQIQVRRATQRDSTLREMMLEYAALDAAHEQLCAQVLGIPDLPAAPEPTQAEIDAEQARRRLAAEGGQG